MTSEYGQEAEHHGVKIRTTKQKIQITFETL